MTITRTYKYMQFYRTYTCFLGQDDYIVDGGTSRSKSILDVGLKELE